jgi:phage gp36-like protein
VSYVLQAEFSQRVGTQETVELTNLDNPAATTVDSSRLEAALTDSSSEINGYLASRYEVPLVQVPGFIKIYCIDIAKYRLAENNPPEGFKNKYESAIARLKDIEKGQMLLVGDDGMAIPKRKAENQLIDSRGNLLDDFTASYQPGGEQVFTESSLSLY